MTSPTSKNLNPSDVWAFRALIAVGVFFLGMLLSWASDAVRPESQVSSKKPVSISSAQLIFDKLKGLTLFKGKVKALHGTVVLTADEIRAFSENNAATAKGHVKVIDKTQSVTLTCGNLEYQDLMDTMTAHDHPILNSIDSAGKPVTILGRQMELNSLKRTVVVNQNVQIQQTTSSAEAQKATFLADDDKLILENDPKVYTSNAQISARRITTNLGPDKSFFAEGMADIVFNPGGEPLPVKKRADETMPGVTPTVTSPEGKTIVPTPTVVPQMTHTPVPTGDATGAFGR